MGSGIEDKRRYRSIYDQSTCNVKNITVKATISYTKINGYISKKMVLRRETRLR